MSDQEHQPLASPKRRRASQTKTGSEHQQVARMPSSPATSELPIGERWGEFPSLERRTELERMLQAWEQESDHAGRAGPFAGYDLNGAAVCWLAARVAGGGNVLIGQQKLTAPDFQVNVSSLHLEGVYLTDAQLQDARLSQAHLQGADFLNAQLQAADLFETHLETASLFEAALQGAYLSKAHLQESNLYRAQLQEADLFRAQLQGAYLAEAQLQGRT